MNEEATAKVGRGQTHNRSGYQFLRNQRPSDQHPKAEAEDKGGDKPGKVGFWQENTPQTEIRRQSTENIQDASSKKNKIFRNLNVIIQYRYILYET